MNLPITDSDGIVFLHLEKNPKAHVKIHQRDLKKKRALKQDAKGS